MGNFWRRFVQLNGPFVAAALREAADQVEQLFPGPAKFGLPIMFREQGGELQMGEITVKDSSAGVSGTASWKDAKGADTTVASEDVSSSDESVATATLNDDGTVDVAIGSPGAAVIEVKGTNEDGTEAVSQGTITVQPGDAVIGDLQFTEKSA